VKQESFGGWTLTAHWQIQLWTRVGNQRVLWNLPYVCWAKKRDGKRIVMFNTEGRSEQEAIEKAKALLKK